MLGDLSHRECDRAVDLDAIGGEREHARNVSFGTGPCCRGCTGPYELGGTMKRLILMLSSLALLGALALGSTVVRADDNPAPGTTTAQCPQGTANQGTANQGPGDQGGSSGTDAVATAADNNGGSPGNDSEHGSSGSDQLSGQGGNDTMDGNGGDDELCGDGGNDHMQGGAGNDNLQGGNGNDTLEGQSGNDNLQGQAGNDLLVGGQGHDVLSGGPGRDRIRARDGQRDHINCGPGVDSVSADKVDVVSSNCEHVSR